ncbi:hypothetical protein BB558_001186 [Smittium angustum]|uniref:Uncharacterized protein n=1 Tax=Smittium angustum TaxID=133377 RepID=A0A2U1JCD1_SMIAN|nr:hypothetical protein BB558_001186 [Smittium angustum]
MRYLKSEKLSDLFEEGKELMKLFFINDFSSSSVNFCLLSKLCEGGNTKLVKFLVQNEANIDGKYGNTLRYACENKHLYVFKFLVERDADTTINPRIQPQQTNVFSTMLDSKSSKHSSKLLDTGPEKNPEEIGQKLNVLEIKQEKNEKTDKEATVTATASNKNNVSGSSGAGSTLDIPSSTASVTENKTSAIKRVEKHKLKMQTPLFAPYSKPNPKKKLNKPTGNVAPMQIKKENTDFNEINDIEIEDGEVIEYEDDSIISAADNVKSIQMKLQLMTIIMIPVIMKC